MINNQKVFALVLARGGSKRIPHKNIKLLAGKPLIAYSIDEAKKSKYVDRIITSTDDSEIAKVAKECGSEVPFIRPEEISGDSVTDYPVFLHALKWLKENANSVGTFKAPLDTTTNTNLTSVVNENSNARADTNSQANSVKCLIAIKMSSRRIKPAIYQIHNLPKAILLVVSLRSKKKRLVIFRKSARNVL